MPFTVTCEACNGSFAFSDKLYEQRVAGRVVVVPCKRCSAKIRVDGKAGTAQNVERPKQAAEPSNKVEASPWAVAESSGSGDPVEASAASGNSGDQAGPPPVPARPKIAMPQPGGSRRFSPPRPGGTPKAQATPAKGLVSPTQEAATQREESAPAPKPVASMTSAASTGVDAEQAEPESETRTQATLAEAEPVASESAPPSSVVDSDRPTWIKEPKAAEVGGELLDPAFSTKPPPPAEGESSDDGAEASLQLTEAETDPPEADEDDESPARTAAPSMPPQAYEAKKELKLPSIEVQVPKGEQTERRKRPPLNPSEVEELRGRSSHRTGIALGLLVIVGILVVGGLRFAGGRGTPTAQSPAGASEKSAAYSMGGTHEAPSAADDLEGEPEAAEKEPPPSEASAPTETKQPEPAVAEPEPSPTEAESELVVQKAEAEPGPAPAEAEPEAESESTEAMAPTPAVAATAEFNKNAAIGALDERLTQARSCRRSPQAPGTAHAMVRFAPAGEVDYVRVVDGTYQATPTALCIESLLKGAPVPGFKGDARALRVRVELF